jgi:transposase
MRYELTDHEWAAIKPMLTNKPRGVPPVNDRRVLKRIRHGLWLRAFAARPEMPPDESVLN